MRSTYASYGLYLYKISDKQLFFTLGKLTEEFYCENFAISFFVGVPNNLMISINC
jgi:hypothetical protein